MRNELKGFPDFYFNANMGSDSCMTANMRSVKSIAAWLRERAAEPTRARAMIMTIFCDVIIPHGGHVALGSLVEAGGLVGISEQAIRSSVNRLIADGWLTSEARGRRSIYRLSDSGALRSMVPIHRVYQCPNTAWTGQWNVLIAKDWRLEHDVYAQATKDLLWAGYGRVADNVFIRPQRDGDHLLCCAGSALEKELVCIIGSAKECMMNGSFEDLASRAWDLESVAERYEAFEERYQPVMVELAKQPSMRSAEAFALRTFMMHDLRRIRVIDPQLPASLLPKGWKGARALELAKNIYQALLPQSEHYVTEYMQGPEGSIPPAEKSFYTRFGGLTPP